MILYLASDLLWATRIKATARALGLEARPVRDPAMLESRLGDSPVRGLILDLEARGAALRMLARLRGPQSGDATRAIRIVAFGPHVDTEGLEAARAAGADLVLPRGAFDRRLEEILQSIEQP